MIVVLVTDGFMRKEKFEEMKKKVLYIMVLSWLSPKVNKAQKVV